MTTKKPRRKSLKANEPGEVADDLGPAYRGTEAQRKEALRKWARTPSPNPRYKGATPADIARALLLPLDPELRAAKVAEWKAERRSVTEGKVAE